MTTDGNPTGTDAGEAADGAAAFPEVLERELALIAARRRIVLGEPNHAEATAAVAPGVVAAAQRTSAFGLAFSGGGIRSATFNLGVLQGLAEKGLLKYVDYLSTVSGGGYIGSWLHGVMYRGGLRGETDAPGLPASDGDRRVIACTQLTRAATTLRSGIRQEPGSSDQDPITFLRKYSNYLAPSPGLFSADTWTIGFIWLRNVLLNQLLLLPAIAAMIALTLLLVLITQHEAPLFNATLGVDVGAAAIALLCLVGAIGWMVRELVAITRRAFPEPAAVATTTANGALPQRVGSAANSTRVVGLVFTALLLLGAGSFVVHGWYTRAVVIGIFVVLMAAIQYAGGYVECHVRSHGSTLTALWDVSWMSIVTGGLAGGLVTLVWDLINGTPWPPYYHLAFGPPLIGVCFVLSVMLLIGLMGADYPDAAREWTARTGSTLAIVTMAWLAWFTLAAFGPWLVTTAFSASNVAAAAGVMTWIATTVGGVLAGRSSRTADGTSTTSNKPLTLLVGMAPTVFLIGYIIAIAAAVHAFVPPALVTAPAPAGATASVGGHTLSITAPRDNRVELVVAPRREGKLQEWLAPITTFGARFPGTLVLAPHRGLARSALPTDGSGQIGWLLVLIVATTATAFIASRRINVNEFSLHHFYKNRLVRCYLGASNTQRRQPNPSTGFDPLDDIPIARLRPDVARDPYYGPYPIINAALNLNTGSELATQERKATSFVFTPEYCGFSTKRMGDNLGTPGLDRNGYRRTAEYSYTGGPNVGTATAISGAAANPNWGYHTSGPMAFLLTVFNARLGWWLGNPRSQQASREPGPRFALRYLFSELLGQTTARSPFVNLSDGGHFDNLGLYELVQRRCRFIIVCDAEEDRMLTFGSLGAAIRKCRADFGVEIDIDPEPIRQSSAAGLSKAHCVVGTIFYPEPETAFSAGMTHEVSPADGSSSRGWLVYLKSSLTGDEPADVLEYQSQFPEFPHQSTGDQFFSESQFESYRRLGYHVCRSAFAEVTIAEHAAAAATQSPARASLRTTALVGLFQEMARKWYAPIKVSSEAATRLADAYVVLMRRIALDRDLAPLSYELTSGKKYSEPRPDNKATTAEIAAGMDLMQLVQNVYTEFNFESAFNRANPRNSGWMAVFGKWWKSPILSKLIWREIKDDYHSLFQVFVEKRLGEDGTVAERP